MEIVTSYYESPIGTIEVIGTDRGVQYVRFTDNKDKVEGVTPFLQQCLNQLQEYFEGDRKGFHSFHLAMMGTDFQQKVWEASMEVKFGEVATYGDIALSIGDKKAARAVGNALNTNPLLLIIPCHRIIPSTGEVGEFAAGSKRKKWLLEHEGVSI